MPADPRTSATPSLEEQATATARCPSCLAPPGVECDKTDGLRWHAHAARVLRMSAMPPDTSGAQPCDRYCDKHAACRLMNGQPVHYFDCDRFEVYNYGTKQGKCDCTATADVNAILAVPNGT